MEEITFKLDDIFFNNKVNELREELQRYITDGDERSYMDFILEKIVIIEASFNKDAKTFNDFVEIQVKTYKEFEKSYIRMSVRIKDLELKMKDIEKRKTLRVIH